jgi:hypothetical protein
VADAGIPKGCTTNCGRRRKILTDWELWAVASETIQQHRAVVVIAERIRAPDLEGDLGEVATWKRAARKIVQLRRE